MISPIKNRLPFRTSGGLSNLLFPVCSFQNAYGYTWSQTSAWSGPRKACIANPFSFHSWRHSNSQKIIQGINIHYAVCMYLKHCLTIPYAVRTHSFPDLWYAVLIFAPDNYNMHPYICHYTCSIIFMELLWVIKYRRRDSNPQKSVTETETYSIPSLLHKYPWWDLNSQLTQVLSLPHIPFCYRGIFILPEELESSLCRV